jgi:hypothetical protein
VQVMRQGFFIAPRRARRKLMPVSRSGFQPL